MISMPHTLMSGVATSIDYNRSKMHTLGIQCNHSKGLWPTLIHH